MLQSGKFGKLNKAIQFPEILNLAPYMSGTSDSSPIYRLYGVVVHLDIMNAAFSGHYVCYVKNALNKWFKIDDSKVMYSIIIICIFRSLSHFIYFRCVIFFNLCFDYLPYQILIFYRMFWFFIPLNVKVFSIFADQPFAAMLVIIGDNVYRFFASNLLNFLFDRRPKNYFIK